MGGSGRIGAASFLFGMLSIGGLAAADTIQLVSQNFDSMNNAGASNLPTGWRIERLNTVRTLGAYLSAGTATNATAGVNMATNAAHGAYNYVVADANVLDGNDNALGFLSSGTVGTQSGNLYFQLTNTGTADVTSLDIAYDVEKYRNGSNPAGYRFQLFYSTTGAVGSWTNAGADFLTSFTADANNSGFAAPPGASVNVNKNLDVPLAVGDSLYLAWNYSVISGTTTTNAQGLGIDNVSILGNTPDEVAAVVPVPLAALGGLALLPLVSLKRFIQVRARAD